jgi:hypothetical protein
MATLTVVEAARVTGVSRSQLYRYIDVLQRELDAAREREKLLTQMMHERETQLTEAAHERETQLLQLMAQMQQQNQRLLDMPRSAPAPPLPSPRSAPAPPLPSPRAAGVDEAPRGEMRRRIVALLQEHPEGLSPAQVRRLMGIDKNLGSTMKAMARDGLLQRIATGQYMVV